MSLLHRRREPVVTHSVTTAPIAARDDSEDRIHRYLLTMGIRTVCFVLMVVFDGWLRWAFAVGAVILPYVAVVLANARAPRVPGRVEGVVVDPHTRHLGR